MRPALAVVCLILLAGCTAPEVPEASPDAATSTTNSTPAPAAKPWTLEVVPFSFDGNLGTFFHGCVFPAGQCTDPYGTVVAGEADLFIERPGANLTSLTFETTWQSTSAWTQDLWVGAMVMTSCDGCNDTEFPDIHGPSPLRLDVQDVSVPLSDEALVHIYVYNPSGFVYDPAIPAYGGASLDQEFRIEGTATFLVPPA